MAVYFFAAHGRIKIGTSTRIQSRLNDWKRMFPGLEMLGVIDGGRRDEQAILAEHAEYNIDGEWFRDCPELRQAVAETIATWKPLPPEKLPLPAAPQPEKFGPSIHFLEKDAGRKKSHDRFFAPLQSELEQITSLKRPGLSAELRAEIAESLLDYIALLSEEARSVFHGPDEDVRPPFDDRANLLDRLRGVRLLLELDAMDEPMRVGI